MHSISTIGSTFGSKIGSKIGGFASRLFGSSNERRIKGYLPRVEAINALEPEVAALSDAELKARTETFRRQLREGTDLEDLLVPAFATVREAAKRTLGQRHFDVQLVGGIGRLTVQRHQQRLAGRHIHPVVAGLPLAQRPARRSLCSQQE